MTESAPVSRSQPLIWIAGGLVAGLILGLSASLLVRPPVEDDGRLVVSTKDSEALEVAFLGDTLEEGYFATSEASAYRSLVLDGLGTPTEEVPVTDIGPRVVPDLPKAIVPGSADLLVVEIGTHNVFVTDPDAFATEYQALLDNVSLTAPNAAVVCLGVWGNADAAREYDTAIGAACRSVGGAFVPLFDIFDDSGTRGPEGRDTFLGAADAFHPNDDGHREIADRIIDRIKLGS